jgi:hypothetical protein
MTARASTLVLCVIGAVLVQGCHAIVGSNQERVHGIIDFYHDGTSGVLTAPDTVEAGVDFPVTITTFGGGCESVGGAEVALSGATATVTVYDYTVSGENVACPDVLRRFPRTTTVRFAGAGTGVLRIVGRRLGPETDWRGVTTTIEKEIVVR